MVDWDLMGYLMGYNGLWTMIFPFVAYNRYRVCADILFFNVSFFPDEFPIVGWIPKNILVDPLKYDAYMEGGAHPVKS